MASRREDEGQVILLAGILLVLGFILFSTQLSLLASLGQQLGREVENPLLEDYLLTRRHLDVLLEDVLRNDQGAIVCPNLVHYAHQSRTVLDMVASLEANRGQFLAWRSLAPNEGTSPQQIRLEVVLTLADSHNRVSDEVTYVYACSGAISRAGCPNPTPDPCLVL